MQMKTKRRKLNMSQYAAVARICKNTMQNGVN